MMSGRKWEAVSAVLLIDHFSVDLLVGKCKQYFQQLGFVAAPRFFSPCQVLVNGKTVL